MSLEQYYLELKEKVMLKDLFPGRIVSFFPKRPNANEKGRNDSSWTR